MPDSQIYRFFRDNGPGVPGTFLCKKKIDPALRPKVGDSISVDIIFERYTITRIETPEVPVRPQAATRVTNDGRIRGTSDGSIRITGVRIKKKSAALLLLESSTQKYFVTPSNKPNRLVSWTSSRIAENQTLKQLFS